MEKLSLKSTVLKLLQQPPNIPSTTKHLHQLHSLLIVRGGAVTEHLPLAAKLADLFADAGRPSLAYLVLKPFHRYPSPFLFNSLLSTIARRPDAAESAVSVYKHMVRDSIPPDKYTFPIVLKACSKFYGIGECRQLHGATLKMGFECDAFVCNALLYAYSVCGEFGCARELFDRMTVRDVVSWTGLISGYVKGGLFQEALELFRRMDVDPNDATLVTLLSVCGRLGELRVGARIHGSMLRRGLGAGLIAGNALLDMYAKCERMEEAKRVFGGMAERDVVSWTSMMSCLAGCERARDAIQLFHGMMESGVEPDKVVLSAVLSACASLGALDSGRWVREYIDRKGFEWDAHIGTALVDMYAKCGCLDEAVATFHEMPYRNISSWNALIGGLAMHGCGNDALQYFDLMVREGIAPNEVTFVAVLSACSHSGLLVQGRRLFNSMTEFYHLKPRIEHYGCIIDLLGRAGLVAEAYKTVRAMPMRPDVLIWGALLSACKAQADVELSQQILNHLLDLEPCDSDSGVYVLLSNIFATNDRWRDVTRMRKLMRRKGIRKEPGSSVVEVNGKAHEFLVGEMDHPQKEEIWKMMYILAKHVQLDCR
ncbi:pentatricopeptide repeat-containing protein [Iris pallida]|uniref:Pentatricopeptide repeat-containing protein n=1 Tax=Iris pallida TaxID=29817 RepID=A0AAX6HQ42_IRIPA|nr:pentatricopeptide repeat-containing protein [Iris pallida]